MSIKRYRDGSFELAVPTVVLARIISGDILASEAWAGYGGDTLALIAGALRKGQEITGCKFIPSDPNSREENQVSLRFGPCKPPVISEKKMNNQ